jgi:purine-binding chemotaxis protein CheW
VPVLCMRRRFGMSEREIGLHDQFLIARASSRLVALVIDEAHSVMEFAPSQLDSLDKAVPGLERFHGLARLDDGMVLIHDLDKFLSADESRRLDVALEQAA